MKTQAVQVAKDPEDQVPVEIFERAIVDCAMGARKLLSSRLTPRAVHVLLRDSTGLPLGDIEMILRHASELDQRYLKQGKDRP